MKTKKLAIWGAGNAGQKLAQKLKNNIHWQVSCFIDDDAELCRKVINGIRVFDQNDLLYFYNIGFISHVVIAMTSIETKRRSELRKFMQENQIPYLILGEKSHYFYGDAFNSERHNGIDFENLFNREIISANEHLIKKSIKNKTIMITGAGGSIGSEIVKQASMYKPKHIILVEISEPASYQINKELQNTSNLLGFTFDTYTRDVKCKKQMRQIFEKYKIDSIFHTAAYKHVPNVENDPISGISNNVFGTKNILELAIEFNCQKFTLISSDKAVRPTSKMGVTKKICEELCLHHQKRNVATKICCVRFGNVVGSSGSVLPLFVEQLSRGGPLTVTHPEMNRYFMSIAEAAQLVIQSTSLCDGGEIFLLDMGSPVFIVDVAKKLIEQEGYTWTFEPNNTSSNAINISFIGLRPGEKLYEELLVDGKSKPTLHPKIYTSDEKLKLKSDQFFDEFAKLEKATEELNEQDLNKFFEAYLNVNTEQ